MSAPTPGGVFPLRCPSKVWGYADGATGDLRVRCTGKFCRVEDHETFHRFDLASGTFVTTRNPITPLTELVTRLEGAQSHGR